MESHHNDKAKLLDRLLKHPKANSVNVWRLNSLGSRARTDYDHHEACQLKSIYNKRPLASPRFMPIGLTFSYILIPSLTDALKTKKQITKTLPSKKSLKTYFCQLIASYTISFCTLADYRGRWSRLVTFSLSVFWRINAKGHSHLLRKNLANAPRLALQTKGTRN